MKNILFLIITLGCLSLSAQTQSDWLLYNPADYGKDGCVMKIKLIYKFDKYQGIECIYFAYTSQEITGYVYNGEHYTVNSGFGWKKQLTTDNIGIGSWENEGSFRFKADIIWGGLINNIGSIENSVNNKFVSQEQHNRDVPIAHLEDYDIVDKFEHIKDREDLSGYTLDNYEVTRCDCGKKGSAIRSFIREQVGYSGAIKKGKTEFYDRKNYQSALNHFRDAQTFEDTDDVRNWINQCKKKLEEEKEEDKKKEEEEIAKNLDENKDDDGFWDGGEKKKESTETEFKKDFWEKADNNTTNGQSTGFWDGGMAMRISQTLKNSSVEKNVVDLIGDIEGYIIGTGVELLGEGYNQNINVSASGHFKVPVVLKSGNNSIAIVLKNGNSILSTEKLTIYCNSKPVKFRATLTWNTNSSDLDIWVINPSNYKCNYQSKFVSNMSLDIDVTNGYGPENITVSSVVNGRYAIGVHNYSSGIGATAKLFIFVDEELTDVLEHTFSQKGELWHSKYLDF